MMCAFIMFASLITVTLERSVSFHWRTARLDPRAEAGPLAQNRCVTRESALRQPALRSGRSIREQDTGHRDEPCEMPVKALFVAMR